LILDIAGEESNSKKKFSMVSENDNKENEVWKFYGKKEFEDSRVRGVAGGP